ncbi:SCR-like 11 [Hibiscus trionum]|uniref:SCR-like 11 n=1 Tax=Hibiscus trionum TaxID=183268 RepID=A0A9W7ILZ3_HIBTR|nr:SCR-like 11 [Hibiscus trionum]
MNKSILIPMLCLALCLALISPSHSQSLKFCPTELKIPGQCGSRGIYECYIAVNAKFGAAAMTKNCSCQPLSNNEQDCKCLIVCQD